jgi:hypothetical protein
LDQGNIENPARKIMNIKFSSLLLFLIGLVISKSLGQTGSSGIPIIVNEDHSSLTLIRVIHKDAFQEGVYKVKLGKEEWVEYRNSGDSILYYLNYEKGYKYQELGGYKTRLVENGKVMLQSQAPPYSLKDTVLTYYAADKTGTWFYFNKSGKIIKQEYFPGRK